MVTGDARGAAPWPRGWMRVRSIAASSSAMPLPSVATVRMTGQAKPSACSSRSTRSAPGWSALLITKMSAISMMPALMAWTSSPMPGTSTTTVTCATRGDFDFVLPDADGLDEDVVAAGGVHQARQVGGGAGQAARWCRAWPWSG